MPKILKQSKHSSNYYLTENNIFEAYDNPYNLSIQDFKLISKTFFTILTTTCIDTGEIYYLPFKLGHFGVFKKATFGRGFFDYQLYKETNIKRWIKNNHSQQYVARFNWDKRFVYDYMLCKGFAIDVCRDMRRYATKKIKEDNSMLKYYDY